MSSVELPEGIESWDEIFPFPSYREKQRATMKAAIRALKKKDIDNVIVDAPTGVGKSAINVAACRAFESAFYTTPQKKLRRQLHNDDILSKHYKALRGREDYTCGVTGDDCKNCSINRGSDKSCTDYDDCTYWANKQEAMGDSTAVLTFAYLIVDGEIPQNSGDSQISFGNRDLLVIDECHSLESQTANLHAGFTVSPWSVPPDCFRNITRNLDRNAERHQEVKDIIDRLYDRCRTYIQENKGKDDFEALVEDAEDFVDQAEWFKTEVEKLNRQWVIDVRSVRHPDKNMDVQAFDLRPVKVDNFLKKYVWSRASNRLLTTATMPYRDNVDAWCYRLGLDPERTHVIKVGMPFPPENRQVHLETMIDSMSGGGDDENWEEIMTTLDGLTGRHSGENGLIHTASYDRAERVYDDASAYSNLAGNVKLHQGKKDAMDFIDEWQDSDKDIVVSPSMTEGVDLYDDLCRWQALLKVPYPYIGDSRVKYILDETGWSGRKWYNETTANSVVQSVGRAVRSKDDHADYYVLDESFEQLRQRVTFPEWFEEAIVTENSPLEW